MEWTKRFVEWWLGESKNSVYKTEWESVAKVYRDVIESSGDGYNALAYPYRTLVSKPMQSQALPTHLISQNAKQAWTIIACGAKLEMHTNVTPLVRDVTCEQCKASAAYAAKV